MKDVLDGHRPGRPATMDSPALDVIWGMINDCWAEDSYARPSASDILSRLKGKRSTSSFTVSIPLFGTANSPVTVEFGSQRIHLDRDHPTWSIDDDATESE